MKGSQGGSRNFHIDSNAQQTTRNISIPVTNEKQSELEEFRTKKVDEVLVIKFVLRSLFWVVTGMAIFCAIYWALAFILNGRCLYFNIIPAFLLVKELILPSQRKLQVCLLREVIGKVILQI